MCEPYVAKQWAAEMTVHESRIVPPQPFFIETCQGMDAGDAWPPTLEYQIRVQHQLRIQADHFEILNNNTVSNNNTGNQIMKFSVIMHSLFDWKLMFFVKIISKILYSQPNF